MGAILATKSLVIAALLCLASCQTLNVSLTAQLGPASNTAPAPPASPATTATPGSGKTFYTSTLGGNGGKQYGPYTCPTGSFAQTITLSFQAGKSLAPVTAVSFRCSNSPPTELFYQSNSGIASASNQQANKTASTLGTRASGFNSATAIVSDFLSGLSFRAADGTSVEMLTSATLTGKSTSTASFNLPTNAQITGFGGAGGDWLDSLYLAYQ